jgi:hypothetical protein
MDIQGIIHESHGHSAQSYNQKDLAPPILLSLYFTFPNDVLHNTDTAHTNDTDITSKSII